MCSRLRYYTAGNNCVIPIAVNLDLLQSRNRIEELRETKKIQVVAGALSEIPVKSFVRIRRNAQSQYT